MGMIDKIELTKSHYYIDIKDAGFSLLCAAPEDCVKLMKKKGLLTNYQIDGFFSQSGPKAILLSDTAIQNGQFSNLSEFPILQMLYFQGMHIPNHPNSHQKPKLIGNKEQLKSQLNYIYRGNYGLNSLDELIEAGYNEKEANLLMNIKLKFAFGKILKSDELIECIELIGNQKIQVDNDVYIKRKNVNIFEIFYKNESVIVDLNLNKKEKYELPYKLNTTYIKRNFFSIVEIGSGDGWDDKNPSVSSIISYKKKLYLVDAGANLWNILQHLSIDANEIEGIFHTHCHDDHFSGLSALIRNGKRIKYFATQAVKNSVQKKLSALTGITENEFENFFDVTILKEDEFNNIDNLMVKPLFSLHPVETNIFIFQSSLDGITKSFAYFCDIASFRVIDDFVKSDVIDEDFANKLKEKYLLECDLKKIDIGSGMIHGESMDFKNDKSATLMLSHISRDIEDDEKHIGKKYSFGENFTLLESEKNCIFEIGCDLLSEYFNTDNISKLVANAKIVTFKDGEDINFLPKKHIYLIISGRVKESLDGVDNELLMGNFIGELDIFNPNKTVATYKALNYVKALEIDSKAFKEFIEKNSFEEMYGKIISLRLLLQTNELFCENIPTNILNKIAYSMKFSLFKKDELLNEKLDQNYIYLLSEGEIEISSELTNSSYTLSNGSFFEKVPNGASFENNQTVIKANSNVFSYKIPLDIVKKTPIAYWKLLEKRNYRCVLLSNCIVGN